MYNRVRFQDSKTQSIKLSIIYFYWFPISKVVEHLVELVNFTTPQHYSLYSF